jgi:hypothetical protein
VRLQFLAVDVFSAAGLQRAVGGTPGSLIRGKAPTIAFTISSLLRSRAQFGNWGTRVPGTLRAGEVRPLGFVAPPGYCSGASLGEGKNKNDRGPFDPCRTAAIKRQDNVSLC